MVQDQALTQTVGFERDIVMFVVFLRLKMIQNDRRMEGTHPDSWFWEERLQVRGFSSRLEIVSGRRSKRSSHNIAFHNINHQTLSFKIEMQYLLLAMNVFIICQ